VPDSKDAVVRKLFRLKKAPTSFRQNSPLSGLQEPREDMTDAIVDRPLSPRQGQGTLGGYFSHPLHRKTVGRISKSVFFRTQALSSQFR
jgi:hypothetical protein